MDGVEELLERPNHLEGLLVLGSLYDSVLDLDGRRIDKLLASRIE